MPYFSPARVSCGSRRNARGPRTHRRRNRHALSASDRSRLLNEGTHMTSPSRNCKGRRHFWASFDVNARNHVEAPLLAVQKTFELFWPGRSSARAAWKRALAREAGEVVIERRLGRRWLVCRELDPTRVGTPLCLGPSAVFVVGGADAARIADGVRRRKTPLPIRIEVKS